MRPVIGDIFNLTADYVQLFAKAQQEIVAGLTAMAKALPKELREHKFTPMALIDAAKTEAMKLQGELLHLDKPGRGGRGSVDSLARIGGFSEQCAAIARWNVGGKPRNRVVTCTAEQSLVLTVSV
jgi:hypothetical protein